MESVIQRLGILGGTFDPIHHGHLIAAEAAHHQLGLNPVLFVPAAIPPHKAGRPVADAQHRLAMLELAIAGKPHFSISRVDLDRPGPCYTLDMLRLLRAEWGPEPRLFFVEGSDSLSDISGWYQPQRIVELCEFAVVHRPGADVDLVRLEEHLPGLADRVHWVQMPSLEISSSDIRARVRSGDPVSYLLPAAVEGYIHQWGLYQR